MEHKLYVYTNSEAEDRLLYLFDKTDTTYYKTKCEATEQGESVNLYVFDDVDYETIKQYLQNEES